MLVTETLTIDGIQYIESGVRRNSHEIKKISHKIVHHFTCSQEEATIILLCFF